jgi:uncharacterized protein YegL
MAAEGKIQALNTAIREVIPHMREVARDQPHADVLLRAVEFSKGARWVQSDPTPVDSFAWTDIAAEGVTDLGAALQLIAAELAVPPMSPRALPPVLVLVSDGQPTDDFGAGLSALLGTGWGERALRIAIGIGRDADYDVLQRFINNPELRPLAAHSPEQLISYIRWASTAVRVVSQAKTTRTGARVSAMVPQPPPTEAATATSEMTW